MSGCVCKGDEKCRSSTKPPRRPSLPLRWLFLEHSLSLVLKSDNGAGVISEAMQRFPKQPQVWPFFSPPRTPQYNGSIKASNNALKTCMHEVAARRALPATRAADHLEAARHIANETESRERSDRRTRGTPAYQMSPFNQVRPPTLFSPSSYTRPRVTAHLRAIEKAPALRYDDVLTYRFTCEWIRLEPGEGYRAKSDAQGQNGLIHARRACRMTPLCHSNFKQNRP